MFTIEIEKVRLGEAFREDLGRCEPYRIGRAVQRTLACPPAFNLCRRPLAVLPSVQP